MKPTVILIPSIHEVYVLLSSLYIDKLDKQDLQHRLLIGSDCYNFIEESTPDELEKVIAFGSGVYPGDDTKYPSHIEFYLRYYDTVQPSPPHSSNIHCIPRKEYIEKVSKLLGLDIGPYESFIIALNDSELAPAVLSMYDKPRTDYKSTMAYINKAKELTLGDIAGYVQFIDRYSVAQAKSLLKYCTRGVSLHGVDIKCLTITRNMAYVFLDDSVPTEPLFAIRYAYYADRDALVLNLPPINARTKDQLELVQYLKRLGATIVSNRAKLFISPDTDLNSL